MDSLLNYESGATFTGDAVRGYLDDYFTGQQARAELGYEQVAVRVVLCYVVVRYIEYYTSPTIVRAVQGLVK